MKKQVIKISLMLVFGVVCSAQSIAQVGIGVGSPDNSAMLEVNSTTRGLLTPRMTQAERTAINPVAQGLIVYQTDGSNGFYYYDGGWIKLINNVDALPAVSGAAVTNLNASNLASGTVPAARLGSGTANGTTYLRGDGQWAAVTAGTPAPVIEYKSAAYTITASDVNSEKMIFCTASSPADFTLPEASTVTPGKVIMVSSTGSNSNVNIVCSGSDKLVGLALPVAGVSDFHDYIGSYILTVHLVSDGAGKWYVKYGYY